LFELLSVQILLSCGSRAVTFVWFVRTFRSALRLFLCMPLVICLVGPCGISLTRLAYQPMNSSNSFDVGRDLHWFGLAAFP
jgi:hypothetical protein